MSSLTSQPSVSIPRGMSVGGPIATGLAPTSSSASTSERATRECRTSPTIATRTSSSLPSASRMVKRSRSAWVGCWCFPSPALTTSASVASATMCGAPMCGCRMTITSGS
jgi:hypothetical protein